MPRVIVLIASEETPDGLRSMPLSDRAAVALALASSPNAAGFYSTDDLTAAEFALAAGITQVEPISEAPAFALAILGESFIALKGDDFAGRLAEQTSAALIFDVLSCEETSPSVRRVIRDAGRGAREILELTGPAVLVVSSAASRPAYVSRYRRQQSRKMLMNSAIQSAISDGIAWQPVRLRTRKMIGTTAEAHADQRMDAAFGVETKTESANGPIIADPATCARHLVRYLAHHGFLSPMAVDLESATPLRLGEGHGPSSISTPVEDSGTCHPAAVARRPRRPQDSPQRQHRQPRLIGQVIMTSPRVPRRIGQPLRPFRGPRRLRTLKEPKAE
jgi:hypothetical protein